MANTIEPNLKKIEGIDGLRAIAALLVFSAHVTIPYLGGGGIGVDIFFAISGFLITLTFVRNKEDLLKFWFNRAFRIYPPLVVTAILACFGILLTHQTSIKELSNNFFPAVLGVANFARYIIDSPTFLGHYWSIAVEEQFYLFYPIAFILISKFFKEWRAGVFLVLAILVCGYRAFLFKYLQVDVGELSQRTDTRIDGLILGVAPALSSPLTQKRVGRLWPLALIGLSVAIVYPKWWHPWLYLGGFGLLSLASCVILANLASNPEGLLSRVLSVRPLQRIGEFSYSFYLFHFPIVRIFHSFGIKSDLVFIVFTLLTTLICAFASWKFLERPILESRVRHFTNWPYSRKVALVSWLPISFILGILYLCMASK